MASINHSDTKLSESLAGPGRRCVNPGKQVAIRYAISIPLAYKEKMLTGFRAQGSATYFRQYTDELWTVPFNELTCAQYGAFRRILAMFARDKNAIRSNLIITTKKELKSFGISEHLLTQLKTKRHVLDISLLSDHSEIKDIPF